MSIKKQYLKSKPVCKVTFRLSSEAAEKAKSVHVVGEFNDWNQQATPMKRLKSGEHIATMDLEIGREYQFRYLIDENIWENDWDADKYIPSLYGGCENSIVVV